jgi:hypothetical protein
MYVILPIFCVVVVVVVLSIDNPPVSCSVNHMKWGKSIMQTCSIAKYLCSCYCSQLVKFAFRLLITWQFSKIHEVF